MTQMPHLPVMEWDFKNQLRVTQQQVVNDGSGERTYYVYDASGQRARKLTERSNGTRKQERIYLGEFEIYREYNGDGSSVTLERETCTSKDGIATYCTDRYKNHGHRVSKSAMFCRYAMITLSAITTISARHRIELDDNGALISYEEYHPYGTLPIRRDEAR